MKPNKVFIGCWVNETTRRKFKAACALHNVHQGDVMGLLLENWMARPHVKEEFKLLTNGEEKQK